MLTETREVQSINLLPIRVTGSRSFKGGICKIAALAIQIFTEGGRKGLKPDGAGREGGIALTD